MWKGIAAKKKKGSEEEVGELKGIWLEEHGFEDIEIKANCFFCEYASQQCEYGSQQKRDVGPKRCQFCPAKLVDKEFDCFCETYHYHRKPIAFYNKLLELNKKRLSSGGYRKASVELAPLAGIIVLL